MNPRASSRPHEDPGPANLAPLATPLDGVSTSLFAGLAAAAVAARVLAPALPGSATGISALIGVMNFVAACSSQLIAAGGIALCVRALSGLWPWPNLGVALRLVIVPITLAVVAFTVTSAARPLAPEFVRIAAVAAVVASVASAPLLCSSGRTRTLGIVLFLSALGGAFSLTAYEIALRPSRLLGIESAQFAAALGLLLDVTATFFALAWSSARRAATSSETSSSARRAATSPSIGARPALIGVSATLVVTLGLAFLAQSGAGQGAHAAFVVLHRSLESLANRPLLALPPFLAQSFSLLPLSGAVALLVIPGRQPELRATLALCLLGRTATGAPVAALLSVGAVLTALSAWLHGTPHPARAATESTETPEAVPNTTAP